LKIYTKTGDKGETGLIDGSRVAKDHVRVASYGDVDELNAVLGLARLESTTELDGLLGLIQRDLFALGAQLADPTARVGERKEKAAAITDAAIERLENAIDAHEARLPTLTSFILPGGSRLGALLHLARTVCRRAERGVVGLSHEAPVDSLLVIYLNRLSDLLFVLARHENQRLGKTEDRW